MKRRGFFLALFLIIFAKDAFAGAWQRVESLHFVVYYMKTESFAKEVSDKAEVYYKTIARDIGYSSPWGHWTFDERPKIYLHPDHDAYVKNTQKPKWSHGMTDAGRKVIITYEGGRYFVTNEILPHQLAQLIFRDFGSFKKDVPVWLEEGVANWEETKKRRMRNRMMMRYYKDDLLFSLKDMVTLNVGMVSMIDSVYIRDMRTKEGEASVGIFSTESFLNAFYIQASSLVGFMLEKLGRDNFPKFCKDLSSGSTVDEAIGAAYPNVRNLAGLEKRWREYLKKQYTGE